LFHLDGGRHAIRRQDDHFVIQERPSNAQALLDEAGSSPARFSPNVLLRPIVQDTLFPTVCYVAGPSELAYLGQLGGVYAEFGVPMPLMYPRASATLLDSAAARFLGRYNVPLGDLQPQDESALNHLLESQLPQSVEQAMRDAHDAVQASMQRLTDALPALDPTLSGAAKTTLGKIEHDLRGLHNKIIHAAKKRDETLRRQFTRAQAQVFPLGHPQERTLAVIYFLNRYGPALVERLLEDLPLEPGYHWLMNI
jgi:bacillithiol biosynthesis cysteine-adding enzyme BshC